jgi:3'-phosphoadenosine 5'-phosphosulfate sulfotransferase (PAPS reductase)/FAD synthetase
MIPPELRDFETYIIAYSGGKDSTAMLLWSLANLPRERLRVVFCDTGAEWPETYDYLNYIERELCIGIERIRVGDRQLPLGRNGRETHGCFRHVHGSLFDLVRARGKWPSARYRYCTQYLKRHPLDLYCDEQSRPVKIFGQRAEESAVRARMSLFDLRGDNTRHPIYRPIFYWSERQVWDYLRTHHILPNPVYNYATRCGCWCCIMARPAKVLNFCRLHPDIAQQAADLEEEIGHTWTARQSIGNLLRQAQAQMPLFERQPRFLEVADG